MLHLEVKQHRLERDFRLKVRVGKPRVSYRETLRGARTVEGECDRTIGGNERRSPGSRSSSEPRQAEQPVTVTNSVKPDDDCRRRSRPPSAGIAVRAAVRRARLPGDERPGDDLRREVGPGAVHRDRPSRPPAPTRSPRGVSATTCSCSSRS